MTLDVSVYLAEQKKFFETELHKWLSPKDTDPSHLHAAMQYSLLADGKRVRPALVFAAAHALGLSQRDVLPIAVAIEMIHVFSLIHDDLPCMDDDDLRRGQPTNHKVFGEALAVLAGDALLTEAFCVLTQLPAETFRPEANLRVVRAFAYATGKNGMIAGQVIDIEAENQTLTLARLERLHALKTGALIRTAVVAPAILCAADVRQMQELQAYAAAIGLAFQIADDILDVEGIDIGKDVGSDVANNKSTYPKLLGLSAAKAAKHKQGQLACKALQDWDARADALRGLAQFIVERKR